MPSDSTGTTIRRYSRVVSEMSAEIARLYFSVPTHAQCSADMPWSVRAPTG